MKKVVRLTESDLTRIVKRVLNEQTKWLSSIFGKSVDDIVKNYGDNSVKTLDDVFGKLFNKGNMITKQGKYFVKSLSGAEIPMETIQDAITLVGQGKLKAVDVSKYLPSKLADGSEFRNLVVNAMDNKMVGKKIGDGFKSMLNHSFFQGQRISNRWYGWKPENIDFTKFSNKMTIDQLNKQIATAIKTKNWNLVPRQGFEKFGIPNFREYLQKNIDIVNEVDPSTGRWSVTFK